jgi:hypothetical protein
MRGGTYRSTYGNSGAAHLYLNSMAGTSSNHIVIQAYNGEVPIFNLDNITTNQSSCFALFMSGSTYLDLKGLVITGLAQPSSATNVAGFYTTGNSSHITIENCVCHDMGGYGFSCNNSTYVTYKNCDAYLCADPNSSNGAWENANGFGVTGGVNQNTSDNITFDGCRSWHNADDGFDFYGVDAYITVKNCWSFWNAYSASFVHEGNGQGFKLGPCFTTTYNNTVRRVITNCISAGNYYHGFDQNWGSSWGTCRMNFYNNLAYANQQMGWEFSYLSGITNIFRNNAALTNGAGTANVASSTHDHNSWDDGVTITSGDFSSLDITQLAGARKADGSLPDVTFGHLVIGSDLIDAGVDVGLPFNGIAPDMGAFEYSLGGGGGNIILTVTGQTLTSTYTTAHTSPTTFTFTNNSLATSNTSGYMLNAGDEGYDASLNEKLDASVVTGNKVTWTGDATSSSTHGLFLGYNINDNVWYNYIDNAPYGVVLKSGNAGTSLNDVSGVVAYNIFHSCNIDVIARGYGGAKIYNNTFYSPYQPYPNGQIGGMIYLDENETAGNAPSPNCKIKNNIFYTTYNEIVIYITNKAGTNASLPGFESDYNIYYSAAGNPYFVIGSTYYTFAQWQALGYDLHSVVINPTFVNTITLVPTARLNYGTNLGTTYQTGLSTTATWTVNVAPSTTVQNGTWQVGASVFAVVTPYIPVVTTTAISSITTTTATGGGNVTSDGGALVTARGICWNTSVNPTTSNNKMTNGTGIGSFTSSMTGLTPNTTYHVRAYATNSVGTAYGSDVFFTTNSITIYVPTVTTTSASAITATTATSGGNITADGGGTITARGVCWSTTSNPTIASSHTSNGTGVGIFTSYITGLTIGTLYHIRAYATNSAGTAYGSDVQFTTIINPSITTIVANNITNNGASFGGTVVSNGGDNTATAGIVWSTSPGPTITSYTGIISPYSISNQTNPFTISISGLFNHLTTYYYRVYITNSISTSYGTEYSFKTLGYPDIIWVKINGAFIKLNGNFVTNN